MILRKVLLLNYSRSCLCYISLSQFQNLIWGIAAKDMCIFANILKSRLLLTPALKIEQQSGSSGNLEVSRLAHKAYPHTLWWRHLPHTSPAHSQMWKVESLPVSAVRWELACPNCERSNPESRAKKASTTPDFSWSVFDPWALIMSLRPR